MLPYLDAIPAARIKRVGCIYNVFVFIPENKNNEYINAFIKFNAINQAVHISLNCVMHPVEKMVNTKLATAEPLELEILKENGIEAEVLRLDKIHEVISGNKWFKLKNYLRDAVLNNYQTVISFGGAYSNHIVATAWAANSMGLQSVGVIRGERPPHLSHSLQKAESFGMQLKFISRSDFQNRKDPENLFALSREFGNYYFIEEGGFGLQGIQGSEEIIQLL
jgi:1-aminocyclopropane-1-carboxylate deaminase